MRVLLEDCGLNQNASSDMEVWRSLSEEFAGRDQVLQMLEINPSGKFYHRKDQNLILLFERKNFKSKDLAAPTVSQRSVSGE